MLASVFHRLGWAVPLVAACVLASTVQAAESTAPPADQSEPAVWTQKELTFVYLGFTTKYSCDGLRDKVRGVLLDLGAEKKGLKVTQFGCTASFGRPDPFPGVQVKMNVLQPADAAAADNQQPPVGAHWKPVDLKLRNSSFTDSGECELVEQIKEKIVPLFATRNVELKTNCIPHQASASRPVLKMEVLVADKPEGRTASTVGR
jgi:hypothetical protein